MKVFLFVAVCFLGFWLWRNRRVNQSKKSPPPETKQALDMVGCQWCGTHVPKSDALSGVGGYYCSTEHRQNAEP
jgi:uncharacterized protein